MGTHAEAAVMLKDARLHLEKVGWTKAAFKAPSGAVCLLQALRDVDGTKHGAAVDAECKRVILKHADATDIPTWNDRASTTKDEVLTLLLACEQIELELAQ